MPWNTYTGATWTIWASNATTTSDTVNVWITWNTTASNTYYVGSNYQPPPETNEQRVQRIERQRVQEAERVAAQERAEQLLRDHLTIEQAAQLLKSNNFDVISESGKRYRVRRGERVLALEGEKATRQYCIHPEGGIPAGDVMLAQKLMLEAAELDFLRIANESPAYA
jgi:hypothetical protein